MGEPRATAASSGAGISEVSLASASSEVVVAPSKRSVSECEVK